MSAYSCPPSSLQLTTSLFIPTSDTGSKANYLCIDILKNFFWQADGGSNQSYGWSSAYSLATLLLQLQAGFLFADSVLNYDGRILDTLRDVSPEEKADRGLAYNYKRTDAEIKQRLAEAKKAAHDFRCTCGHSMTDGKCYPPLPSATASAKTLTKTESTTDDAAADATVNNTNDGKRSGGGTMEVDAYDEMDSKRVMKRTKMPSGGGGAGGVAGGAGGGAGVGSFATTASSNTTKAEAAELQAAGREIVCFHTKETLFEAVLGFGVTAQYYPGSAKLKAMQLVLDFVSLHAFEELGVRQGAFRAPFADILPLALTPGHYARAKKAIHQTLWRLWGRTTSAKPAPAHVVLGVLTSAMNSMVVSFMSEFETNLKLTHASEAALNAYCMLHHLLLCLANDDPSIVDLANKRVDSFLDDAANRVKSSCPNLGEWLVLLTLCTKRTWADAALPFLLEVFDRNVRWNLRSHPHLARADLAVTDRLKTTFEASTTSLRLIMFQAYFGRVAAGPGSTRARLKQAYDARLGQASQEQRTQLVTAAKGIMGVTAWPQFFAAVQVATPSPVKLASILTQAHARSLTKGYHSAPRHRGGGRGGYNSNGYGGYNRSGRGYRGRGGGRRWR